MSTPPIEHPPSKRPGVPMPHLMTRLYRRRVARSASVGAECFYGNLAQDIWRAFPRCACSRRNLAAEFQPHRYTLIRTNRTLSTYALEARQTPPNRQGRLKCREARLTLSCSLTVSF